MWGTSPETQNFVIICSDGLIPAYSKKLPNHAPYFLFLTLYLLLVALRYFYFKYLQNSLAVFIVISITCS